MTSAHSSEKNIWECSRGEMKNHTCHFDTGDDQIDVTGETIKVQHDGRFSMTQSPVPGADTEWEGVKILKFNNRKFLELLMWEPPVGPTQTQELRWVTFELAAGRLKKVGNESVQERSKDTDSPSIQEFVGSVRDKFGLSEGSDGRVIWQHKSTRKTLK